jgi:small subunit ribosomal protein S3
MSVNKYFIKDSLKKSEIDEYLASELKRAGYSRAEVTKTPLGTRIVIYAARPGMVIGRRGQSIRDLTHVFEERFGLENPQISVASVDVAELNPDVVASQVGQALERGVHFRRAAYWALQRVMNSGARGAEIVIRGKLSTERARYEKFKDGYLPKCGDPALKNIRRAVSYIQLKQGLFGINVKILPADAKFPDQIQLRDLAPIEEESVSEKKEEVEVVADTEKT